MPTQQIVSTPARSSIFLTLTINEGAEAEVREILTQISSLTRGVSFRVPDAELICVLGIGAKAWDRLFGQDPLVPVPKNLTPFEEIRGARHVAVSTPGDLLVHLRAKSLDMCFELARQITQRLSSATKVIDEVHGFKFFDERDLLGFVDGTENPEGDAALRAAVVGDEDPRFKGGSYVIVQKYLHDMAAWESLSVEEQQKVIGRTKVEDVELQDDVKPSNSHVALNTVEDEAGNQRQILRDNMPFGQLGVREFGTYFIGYAADPEVTRTMLKNMFVGKPEGNYDRILDFSTAVTGALFFAPPLEFLDDPHA